MRNFLLRTSTTSLHNKNYVVFFIFRQPDLDFQFSFCVPFLLRWYICEWYRCCRDLIYLPILQYPFLTYRKSVQIIFLNCAEILWTVLPVPPDIIFSSQTICCFGPMPFHFLSGIWYLMWFHTASKTMIIQKRHGKKNCLSGWRNWTLHKRPKWSFFLYEVIIVF